MCYYYLDVANPANEGFRGEFMLCRVKEPHMAGQVASIFSHACGDGLGLMNEKRCI